MKREKHTFSPENEPSRPLQYESSAAADKPVAPQNILSDEFFELIYEWDPGAANDDYYVTSAEFIGLHAEIKAFLVRRMIAWAASVCAGMTALAYFYA